MRHHRVAVAAALTATAVASLAVPTPAGASDYYTACIGKQRRAYNQDVRDIGRFWADVVWVGREAACRNGWTQL